MPSTEDTVISEDTEIEETQSQVTPDAENDAPLATDEESLTNETGETQEHETEENQEEVEEKPLTAEEIESLRKERDELKKRVSNSTREFQKFQEERERLQKQIEEQQALRADLDKLRHESQTKALPIYHPDNPDSENFRRKIPAIEGLRQYAQTINGKVDSEQIPVLVDAYARSLGITEQDIAAHRDYQSWLHQENLAWADPKLREEKIKGTIRAQIKAEQDNLSASKQSQEYYNGLFKQYEANLKNDDGTPNDQRWQEVMQGITKGYAPEIILQRYVIEDLNQRLGKSTSKVQEAQARATAQSKAGKAKATAERDQIAERRVTAEQIRESAKKTYMKEYGMKPDYDSKNWHRILVEEELKFKSSN